MAEPAQHRRREVPRLALTPKEAAYSIGMAESTFRENVLPDLKTIHVGGKRLVRVETLDQWLKRRET